MLNHWLSLPTPPYPPVTGKQSHKLSLFVLAHVFLKEFLHYSSILGRDELYLSIFARYNYLAHHVE